MQRPTFTRVGQLVIGVLIRREIPSGRTRAPRPSRTRCECRTREEESGGGVLRVAGVVWGGAGCAGYICAVGGVWGWW